MTLCIEAVERAIPAEVPMSRFVGSGDTSSLEQSNRLFVMSYANVKSELGQRARDFDLHDSVLDGFRIQGRLPTEAFATTSEKDDFAARTGMSSACVSDDKTASAMAQDVVSRLQETLMADGRWQDPDYILYCHTTPDESLFVTPAMGVQSMFGNQALLPFSVSQTDSAAGFYGLGLARDLIGDSPDVAVLLVTADRFFSPVPRRIGDLTFQSDAAAATFLTVRDDDRKTPLRVDLVRTRQLDGFIDVYGMDSNDLGALSQKIQHELVLLIADTMEEAGLASSDLSHVVPQVVSNPFVRSVHEALKIEGVNCTTGAAGGAHNFATSSPFVGLAGLPEQSSNERENILLWGIGLCGCVACAVVERVVVR